MTANSAPRIGLPGHVVGALIGFGTAWSAMLAWRGFTSRSELYLTDLVAVGLPLVLLGAAGRAARLSTAVVLPVQALLAWLGLTWQLTGNPFAVDAVGTTMRAAIDASREYAAPVPTEAGDGVQPLLLAGGLLVVLLVDALALGLRRVPLAGLPVLTVYSVPIGLLGGGLSWYVFALSAWGFLTLLFLQEQDQVLRWGRDLGPGTSRRRLGERVRVSSAGVGSLAVAAAVAAPLLLPTLDVALLDVGQGAGSPERIEIVNPIADLRRDLTRGRDRDLLTVVTDDPAPAYLRISVLNRFTENQWSSGDRDIPSDQGADGDQPAPPGVPASLPRTEYDYRVEVTDRFESRWLPTQPVVSAVDAAGDWRYDVGSRDFLAAEDDLTTAGLDYTMTAVTLDYDEERLSTETARAGGLPAELTALPAALNPQIARLAATVTRDADTPFRKAQALQQWFRVDGGFVYDLEPTSPDDGVGTDELSDFLLSNSEGGRRGYCEQFAAAMAVMARTLGIPARVAVGFLTPERVGPDTYTYSSHDLHAWPELYFPGAGWMRFEPTPSSRASEDLLPDYSVGADPSDVDQPEVPEPTQVPSQGPIDRPSERPEPTPRPTPAPTAAADPDSGTPWLVVATVLGGTLLLLGAALAPGALRRRARDRRLAGSVEDHWSELAATATDLGLPWPEGRSPHEVGRRARSWCGEPADDDVVAAWDRIVAAVEAARFADPGRPVPATRADTERVREAWVAAAPRRRLARWWPRSLWRRPGRAPVTAPGDRVGASR
ncbi:DUF3488 and DUF4129 domain-containing transglutaminase family protein [Nocardioides sp.]|uniref:transglutaminase TgpA family protein n=1 Tax=Nocardioides sp. TaxID=35761 RepID=UPI003518A1E6